MHELAGILAHGKSSRRRLSSFHGTSALSSLS